MRERSRRHNARGSRARAAAGALVLSLSGLLVSCASLLGVEDYKDSTGELCDLLEACYNYENCSQHIGPPLDSASPAVRTLWLASLSDKACLEQCTSARRCLDIAPVCIAQGEACGRIEDCCGFLGGTAGCEAPLTGGAKRCCLADGMTCTESGQCCSADCDPRTNTCGGEICSAVGQPCKSDIYCCTGLCGPDNVCLANICSTEGQACALDTECCIGLTCLDGRCGVGSNCRAEGEKCYVDSPDPKEGCCTGACVSTNEEGTLMAGLCSQQGCLPPSASCAANLTGCCAGTVCDKNKLQCGQLCQGYQAPCLQGYECCSGACVEGACACSEGACNESLDCCDSPESKGACFAGACAPKCAPRECHNICAVGAPMDGSTCPGEPKEKIDAITAVSAADPYCRCVKWDDLCAEAAVKATVNGVCI